MLVAFLVRILLPGRTALVFWLRLLFFLGTLQWPICSDDRGHFGISFLELSILFEQWAGHRLLSEKVTRPRIRADRLILIPSIPVSEGIEIRHGCQFISSLVRALSTKLPGGLGRFLPCRVGSHMSRLRHLGWDRCSHGLASPKGSVSELPDGTLKLRDCTTPFSMRLLHCLYLVLVMVVVNGGLLLLVILSMQVVMWVKGSGLPGRHVKVHLLTVIPDPGHPTPRRWKRLRPPSLHRRGGRGGRASQSFSSPWGWVRFALVRF